MSSEKIVNKGAKAEADTIADQINRQIADEGQVLLYNNGVLPLDTADRKITVFGIASQDVVFSGGGSGSAGQNARSTKYNWDNAFEEQGFTMNPTVHGIYAKTISAGAQIAQKYLENDIAQFQGASIVSTYASYNDAAIIILHRRGTENDDLLTYNAPGHSDQNETELDLQDNEKALIRLMKNLKILIYLKYLNQMMRKKIKIIIAEEI